MNEYFGNNEAEMMVKIILQLIFSVDAMVRLIRAENSFSTINSNIEGHFTAATLIL